MGLVRYHGDHPVIMGSFQVICNEVEWLHITSGPQCKDWNANHHKAKLFSQYQLFGMLLEKVILDEKTKSTLGFKNEWSQV